MADNLSDKLSSMLNNPDIVNTISEMAQKLKTTSNAQPSDNTADLSSLANIASRLNNDDDDRIRLLNALRPYMSAKRSGNMDTAIKILKLTRITSLL